MKARSDELFKFLRIPTERKREMIGEGDGGRAALLKEPGWPVK